MNQPKKLEEQPKWVADYNSTIAPIVTGEKGLREHLKIKIEKIDALCKQLDERDQILKDIIKGFEERIHELEGRHSDYWRAVKDTYTSSLNFIKLKVKSLDL